MPGIGVPGLSNMNLLVVWADIAYRRMNSTRSNHQAWALARHHNPGSRNSIGTRLSASPLLLCGRRWGT